MSNRSVINLVKGQRVSDGAGVRLTRVMGLHQLPSLDPFLMLDDFHSDNLDDYIGGFPPHPHRGFETVSYLFAGNMRHKDSAGNEGVIRAGGVQWMTAGKGIIHSEMPEQENGLLHGIQLWVNLPAEHKMTEPAYQEFDSSQIPTEERDGSNIHVVTGTTTQGTTGPVVNHYIKPLYFDVELDENGAFIESIEESHNTFIYVTEGTVEVIGDSNKHSVSSNELAVFSKGTNLHIQNQSEKSRFLLISGQPIKETIVRGGPFVMNTQDELEQAYSDYKNGNFI